MWPVSNLFCHPTRWSVCSHLLGAGSPSRKWTDWEESEIDGSLGWTYRRKEGVRRRRSSWETAANAGWTPRTERTSTCCTMLWRVSWKQGTVCEEVAPMCVDVKTLCVCLRMEVWGRAADQLVPARSWEEGRSLLTAWTGDSAHCCHRTPPHRCSAQQLWQNH